jgi:AcrR family transcriptional regulator
MHLQRYAGIGRANSVDNYNFRVNYIFVTDGRRDRKLAQTRLALLTALRERLAERPLEEINVRELAEAADVSEATFYNHFPTKTDLAVYFVQLWSVDAGWHAAAADRHGPRAAITAIFDATAADVARAPRVMGEVIAVQARLSGKATPPPLTALEKRLAFPDRPGVDAIEAIGLDGLLPPRIAAARACGELPAGGDDSAAFLALTSVFFGVPLLLARRAPAAIAAAYRAQLAIVWAGLTATAGKDPS